MEHDKYAIYIIILVAVVGLVSLVGLTMSDDLSGQGFKAFNNRQNVLSTNTPEINTESSGVISYATDDLYACSETDDGYDIDMIGVLNYGGVEVTDDCDEFGYLMEWSCDDCGGALVTKVQCDAGCNNGACNSLEFVELPQENTITLENCREEDEGHNVYEYSTLIYNQVPTQEDECLDTNTIREYWCLDENSFSYTDDVCPDTYVCSNGECVSESCVDEDGGREYYEKGKVSFGTYSAEDECIDNFRVKEY